MDNTTKIINSLGNFENIKELDDKYFEITGDRIDRLLLMIHFSQFIVDKLQDDYGINYPTHLVKNEISDIINKYLKERQQLQ